MISQNDLLFLDRLHRIDAFSKVELASKPTGFRAKNYSSLSEIFEVEGDT